ncbi:calcium-activated chloride channel regulator 1-like [Anolis sagrei]|uniref:calcium-activated chloride channel regulator 1-like n=1 Tax=Anolis sagrei TaxID=38937 RepID=UPI0035211784
MAQKEWHLFLVLLLLLRGAKGSLVKLNNGGYEDVVIGIHPSIAENTKIINTLKDMLKEASSYLYHASQQRFYFRTIKIVIPSTWASKPEYKRVSRESYENADIIVEEPFLKFVDDPYTLQYGGCGIKGRYIHFTSDFLIEDHFLGFYGSRGRVLVHEWAHLRWGVFDEYSNDAPFYSTGANKSEATRCSAGITGQYIFQISEGEIRNCRTERQTELYEPGCLFIPHIKQTSLASIMFMQSLSSISQFCDKSNHNLMAPNMQNKMCSYKSTWEVIMGSADFASSRPLDAPPPDPTIHLMKMQERTVCLVLDTSGRMEKVNRLGRLNQAAKLFLLQIIESGSWVGIVTFSSEAATKSVLQKIVNDRVRQTLASYLPTTAVGESKICEGVLAGFQIFLKKYPSSEGCEIVLLTHGEDPAIRSCFPQIQNSGSIIHTIALGSEASNDLEKLADMTGGLTFYATDSLDSNGLIDAFSGISSGSGDVSQQSIQLESKSQSINGRKLMNGIVTIDQTVGNDTFFLITWSASTSPPEISLTDPKGKKYTKTDFVIENSNIRTARLKIPGTAEIGRWVYSIQNIHSAAQVISITVTTRAADASVPPVTVKSYMSTSSNAFPNPMIIYAEVTHGLFPVFGAIVMATVESTFDKPEKLELFDDGAGADIKKFDGIYSRYFTAFKNNGRYSIKVSVQGGGKLFRRTHRQRQGIYLPGFIADDGTIHLNPPRPVRNVTDTSLGIGGFNRVVSGGSFVITDIPAGGTSDVFPPNKITDLEVIFNKDNEFVLSWTAPGDNFDSGQADRYEIKKSENPLDLTEANFPNATSLDTSDLIPELAGTKQSFRYKPEKLSKENGTFVYFAIRAIDGSNNVGEVSNIARATLFIEDPPTPTIVTPRGPSKFIATIVGIVCSLATLFVIVGTTFYILHKRKIKRPASTHTIASMDQVTVP